MVREVQRTVKSVNTESLLNSDTNRAKRKWFALLTPIKLDAEVPCGALITSWLLIIYSMRPSTCHIQLDVSQVHSSLESGPWDIT